MKKNNKGFFLAETIVVIALVTTVMAFVYPNVTKLYDNYVNRTKYYDQTEDLYVLIAIRDYFDRKSDDGNMMLYELTDEGCSEIDNLKMFFDVNINIEKSGHFYKTGDNGQTETLCDSGEGSSCVDVSNNLEESGLKEVYITGYMASPSSNNYNFNRYLKRMKKTTYDSSSYRLIGVFEEEDNEGNPIEVRYASIKIDNPNPDRNCNLGGE